jgi:hypothetical protein
MVVPLSVYDKQPHGLGRYLATVQYVRHRRAAADLVRHRDPIALRLADFVRMVSVKRRSPFGDRLHVDIERSERAVGLVWKVERAVTRLVGDRALLEDQAIASLVIRAQLLHRVCKGLHQQAVPAVLEHRPVQWVLRCVPDVRSYLHEEEVANSMVAEHLFQNIRGTGALCWLPWLRLWF